MKIKRKGQSWIDIHCPISKAEQLSLYAEKGLIPEKVALFRDFCIVLDTAVESSYLGHDYIDNEEKMNQNFSWCFRYTVSEFTNRGYKFWTGTILEDFLRNTYIEDFYQKGGTPIYTIKRHWNQIFDYDLPKSWVQINLMVELYELFKNSLNSTDSK